MTTAESDVCRRQNLTSTDVKSDVYRRQIMTTKVYPRAVRAITERRSAIVYTACRVGSNPAWCSFFSKCHISPLNDRTLL